MTPSAAAIIGSVPTDKAGVGSAVMNSMRQVGGSIGDRADRRDHRGQGRRPALTRGVRRRVLDRARSSPRAFAFVGAIVAAVTVRKVRHETPVPLVEPA